MLALSWQPRFCLGALALLLCSAQQAEDWLRAGNRAYAQGSFAEAVNLYARAISHTLDPGQVMFQQGAAYSALNQDEQAATAYLRCLEDARGVRRVLALYGRGNALAQLGHQRSGRLAVGQLQQALQCYEQSLATFQQLELAEQAQYSEHEANVRHNLALLRQLLAQKEKEAAEQPEVKSPQEPSQPPASEQPEASSGEKPNTRSDSQPGGGDNPQATDQNRPGRGQLPLLLDDKNAPPLTAEQARDYLRHTLERLQQQRGQNQGPLPPGARDW